MDYLMLFLGGLVLADALLTMAIIKRGAGHEGNIGLTRFDAWLHARGWGARWGWLAVSRAAVLLVLAAFYFSGYAEYAEGGALLGLLTAWYALVVWSGVRVLRGGAPIFKLPE